MCSCTVDFIKFSLSLSLFLCYLFDVQFWLLFCYVDSHWSLHYRYRNQLRFSLPVHTYGLTYTFIVKLCLRCLAAFLWWWSVPLLDTEHSCCEPPNHDSNIKYHKYVLKENLQVVGIFLEFLWGELGGGGGGGGNIGFEVMVSVYVTVVDSSFQFSL